MKHLAKMLIVFCLFGHETMQAQQAVAASGGNAAGAGGTVSYTVGQAAYTTNVSSSGTVAQGCQQPFEIYVLTGLEETREINVEFMVYPNPSSGLIKLTVSNNELKDLGFRLYNNSGILIQNKRITDRETFIEMGDLPSATYYLNIYDNNKELKTFILIK
ncbi:MAG: T9SS type A sorting domain-containing protein, partial [Bacteroidales bacterium]|nr:T9SS type A sorting domain-containing protein [Bacteroidales bacterium]